VKSSTGRMSPLTTELSKPAEAEKHMDDEVLSVFYFVIARYETLIILFAFLRHALFDGVLARGSQCSQREVHPNFF
jgi:hypothetical protein